MNSVGLTMILGMKLNMWVSKSFRELAAFVKDVSLTSLPSTLNVQSLYCEQQKIKNHGYQINRY